MGGTGSGRGRTKTSVADCRAIDIGELCDAGRLASHPRGKIRWVEARSGYTRGRLSYTIAELLWFGGEVLLTLTLHYRNRPGAPQGCTDIVLVGGGAGRRYYAQCPFCERRVRKLYGPPGEEHFLCWRCHGLVHRRVPALEKRAAQADLQAARGSLCEGLYRPSPASESPAALKASSELLLGMLHNEKPLEPQELRIYCLRLAKAGYSLRRSVALVGISKSSVARILAAGLGGVDSMALLDERLERYSSLPQVDEEEDNLGLISAQLAVLQQRARRYGRNRERPEREPERRVLIAQGPDDEVSAALARRCVLADGTSSLPCLSDHCQGREPPCPRALQSAGEDTV